MKYVAITACPTGIAHTYMAAEALEQAAKDNGDEHMTVLAALARRLVRAEFKQTLLEATDTAALAAYVSEEVAP